MRPLPDGRQLARRAPRAGAPETSDRGRAQRLAPVRNALLERALTPIRKLLEIDLFEDPEGETFGPMKVPGGLKRPVRLDALPQRERAAGPDRGQIGRRADPLLIARSAMDRIDAGDGLALLLGGDGGLAFASVHIASPAASLARMGSCSRRASTGGSGRR